jgi:AAA ATPase domain
MSDLVGTPVAPPAEQGGLRLATFFERVQAHNPFLDNRINGPSANDADVAGIHQAGFLRLTELAGEALRSRRGVGVVLWGEAGIGKSHLLSRLGRWMGKQADQVDSRRRELPIRAGANFAYLHNLQAAPHALPRSLLRNVVSILTRGQANKFRHTPLFELVRAAVLESMGNDRGPHLWSKVERAYNAWVDRLGRQDLPGTTLLDRSVYEVLFRFFRSVCLKLEGQDNGRTAEVAVRWLSGQGLDAEEAALLALPPSRQREEATALDDDQQIKQVLVALTRLAACQQQPFILAFDQVDNLDADQVAALARFLEALIDSSPNLLVVTAGIQASLLGWRDAKVIQDSSWDRLGQFQVQLGRVTPEEARQIVRTRLDGFLKPFAGVAELDALVLQDALFPLGTGWSERHLRNRVDIRPRDVINWAREGWRQQQERLRAQGGPGWLDGWTRCAENTTGDQERVFSADALHDAIDQVVTAKLADHLALRRDHPETLPADADNLAGLLYALLCQCREASDDYGLVRVERSASPGRFAQAQTSRGTRPPHDLEIDLRRPDDLSPVRIGVLIVTAANAVSVTGALRRLVSNTRPVERRVLVTDERVGLPLGSQGQNYLDFLLKDTATRLQRIELSFAEYAELDALQTVVGLARSAELEIELRPGQARPVTAQEVIDSHHRQGRYLAARLLHDLLNPKAEQQPVQA